MNTSLAPQLNCVSPQTCFDESKRGVFFVLENMLVTPKPSPSVRRPQTRSGASTVRHGESAGSGSAQNDKAARLARVDKLLKMRKDAPVFAKEVPIRRDPEVARPQLKMFPQSDVHCSNNVRAALTPRPTDASPPARGGRRHFSPSPELRHESHVSTGRRVASPSPEARLKPWDKGDAARPAIHMVVHPNAVVPEKPRGLRSASTHSQDNGSTFSRVTDHESVGRASPLPPQRKTGVRLNVTDSKSIKPDLPQRNPKYSSENPRFWSRQSDMIFGGRRLDVPSLGGKLAPHRSDVAERVEGRGRSASAPRQSAVADPNTVQDREPSHARKGVRCLTPPSRHEPLCVFDCSAQDRASPSRRCFPLASATSPQHWLSFAPAPDSPSRRGGKRCGLLLATSRDGCAPMGKRGGTGQGNAHQQNVVGAGASQMTPAPAGPKPVAPRRSAIMDALSWD